MALLACPGATLGSGLLADPCQSCKRRADHSDMLPVVRWVEAPDFAGYECANQVKPAKPRHRSEVWSRLADATFAGAVAEIAETG